MDKKKNQLPLSSIKILDLSRMLPGPYCSMVLADLGAEVIRVENPRYPYANPPPLFRKGRYNESAFNAILMRNKKSIALNLKKEEGKEIFYELAKEADVILETFRPKVVEKLNIGYDTISEINPSIIYCALTGYGQNGPYEQLAGHDMNYLGICGIMNLNRPRTHYDKPDEVRKPVVPGMQCADIGGALVAVIAIQGAIIEREKNESKKGQYIDISMLDSAFSFMPMAAAYHFAQSVNEKPLRSENPLHGAMPYYSVYRTKDNKFLTIGAIEMKFW
ncbi:MAG: CaiB/BaiF CoA transferase family protein, partial [Promethearchaeia archaeon]